MQEDPQIYKYIKRILEFRFWILEFEFHIPLRTLRSA